MISTRLFFIFSFVLLNSLGSFICSSEFSKECMPERSLADLRKDYQFQYLRQTDWNKELIWRKAQLRQRESEWRHADTYTTVNELKKMQDDITKTQKKLASTEDQMKKAHKVLFDLRNCIEEREYSRPPIE